MPSIDTTCLSFTQALPSGTPGSQSHTTFASHRVPTLTSQTNLQQQQQQHAHQQRPTVQKPPQQRLTPASASGQHTHTPAAQVPRRFPPPPALMGPDGRPLPSLSGMPQPTNTVGRPPHEASLRQNLVEMYNRLCQQVKLIRHNTSQVCAGGACVCMWERGGGRGREMNV